MTKAADRQLPVDGEADEKLVLERRHFGGFVVRRSEFDLEAHCGRCGHGRLPGACLQGSCQAWVVAQPPVTSAPGGFDSDGAQLVWADIGLSSVMEIPVDGGAALTVEHDSSLAIYPAGPSLQNGIIAWATASSLWTGTEGQSNSGIKDPIDPQRTCRSRSGTRYLQSPAA